MGCEKGAGSFKRCDEPFHWVKILNNPYALANGYRSAYKRQCKHCGSCGVMEREKPAEGSKILSEQESEAYAGDRKLYIQQKRLQQLNDEYERKEQQRLEYKEEYHRYLQTDTWRAKRELILKRDNYVCQSCLTKQATEVHHLTYQSYEEQPGSEKGWELISVCRDCHEREHA